MGVHPLELIGSASCRAVFLSEKYKGFSKFKILDLCHILMSYASFVII